MTVMGWLLIVLIFAAVLAAAVPLGAHIARVMNGERTFMSPLLAPVERGFYALAGVNPQREQGWRGYTLAMLAFSAAGFFTLYALQRLQSYLPFNPQGFAGVDPALAFNTAVSFVTNTNWQNYGGETTMSHLMQMAGLTTHNFVSAATGLAMALAMIRAFSRSASTTIGNFWVDLTRGVLYLLLPISIVLALVMVASGVPQTLLGSVEATTLEGVKQVIAIGPVASQEAIKELGTNGGGFFDANSEPFETPCWTTAPQIWTLLLFPVATVTPSAASSETARKGRAAVTIGIVLLPARG